MLEIVQNAIQGQYPPPDNYVKKVLRRLIDVAEENGEELNEEILMLYTRMISTPAQVSCCTMFYNSCPQNEDWVYKKLTYGSRSGKELDQMTIRASQNMLQGGTGCKDWEAGILMGAFILNHAAVFKGKISGFDWTRRISVRSFGFGTGMWRWPDWHVPPTSKAWMLSSVRWKQPDLGKLPNKSGNKQHTLNARLPETRSSISGEKLELSLFKE